MIPMLKTALLIFSMMIWYSFIWLLVLLIPKNTPLLPPTLVVNLVRPLPSAHLVEEIPVLPTPKVVTPVKQTQAPILTQKSVKKESVARKKTPVPVKKTSSKKTPPKKTPQTKKVPIAKKQVTAKTQAVQTNPVATTPIQTPSPAKSAPPRTMPTKVVKPPVIRTPPSFSAAYLHNPKPQYPKLSRRLGEQGRVILRVKVNQNGQAEQVQLNASSGFTRLDTAAQNAVQNWRFIPAQRNGQAISDWVIVPIVFNLSN